MRGGRPRGSEGVGESGRGGEKRKSERGVKKNKEEEEGGGRGNGGGREAEREEGSVGEDRCGVGRERG